MDWVDNQELEGTELHLHLGDSIHSHTDGGIIEMNEDPQYSYLLRCVDKR